MKKTFIDAEAICKECREGYLVATCEDCVIKEHKENKAVDAVEVVRCEDCKNSRERDKDEQRFLVEGVLICTSLDATDDCWNAVWPDHYCSYGVRREDDAHLE